MEIKDISKLEDNFSELTEYSEAQFKTILNLQKEIEKLQSENRNLKLILEQNTPSIIPDLGLGISNEQLICETQLQFLKEQAITRQLTMEEARKVELFSNVLEKVKGKKVDDNGASVHKLSEEELLKIVNVSN